MKKYHQFLNILNILICLLSFISFINPSYLIYHSFIQMMSIPFFIVVIGNIILSIIYFRRKRILNAFIALLVSILFFISNWGRIGIIGNIFVIILSTIHIFLGSQLEDTVNKKLPIIFFSILYLLSILIFLMPIFMNTINVNNFHTAMLHMESNINNDTYIIDKKDEYIFYDKKGKELNRIDANTYGNIYLSSYNGSGKSSVSKFKLMGFGTNFYGREVTLGLTDKGYILDENGNVLLKLCNFFDESISVFTGFLNYLVSTNQMTI
ncbi:MAG: hypothetical protein ACLU84_08570 [Clostridia bacterium]